MRKSGRRAPTPAALRPGLGAFAHSLSVASQRNTTNRIFFDLARAVVLATIPFVERLLLQKKSTSL